MYKFRVLGKTITYSKLRILRNITPKLSVSPAPRPHILSQESSLLSNAKINNFLSSQYSTDAGSGTPPPPETTPLGIPDPPTLNLSPACIKQILKITDPTIPYLRITVEGGGCSGFQYLFSLDSSFNPDEDQIFSQNGAKVVIDKVSLDYLNGATIDYEEELIRSSFRIVGNPNAENGCSCGASFNIKI